MTMAALPDPSILSFRANSLVDLPSAREDLSEVSIISSGAEESDNEEIHLGKGHDLLHEELPQFGYLSQNKCYKFVRELFLVSTYPRIHRAAFRSRYGICLERSRQLASFPWMIHPYSVFRWTWDIILSLVLLYTLIRQPLVMAYLRDQITSEEHSVTLFLVVLFMVDMILNFRTGIVSKHSDVIILDPSLVARNYLATWFVIDFVSTIPFDAIFYYIERYSSAGHANKYVHGLRLVGLLRIFRISRVIRYVTRLQEAYIMNAMYIRIINLHIIITLALHWLACVHYLVADMMNPPEMEKKKKNSWITRQNLWNQTTPIKYINSVIRALSNMACLGYGLETPIEPEDILCTIASILIGATFFALFVGNLSSILINTDVAQKKYSEILNQVMEYMRFKQIPEELQNRVIMYYEQRYRRSFFNEDQILANVSDVLRRELLVYNCRHLVDQVPLFKGVPQAVMQSIVARLKFEVYLPQDVIVNVGTVGDAMYFIEHGAVSVLTPTGRAIAFLKDGDFFGEMSLLTHQHRNASVVALGYCDTYRLDKTDFEECIEGYPEVYEQMLKIAEARAQSLNSEGTTKLHPEKYNSKMPKRQKKK